MGNHDERLVESVRSALNAGEASRGMGRRHFLKSSLATAAVSLLPLHFLSRGGLFPAAFAADSPYGPLSPCPDDVTGNTYLSLPPGFSYMSFGGVGTMMDDGIATPGQHDGMGVCRVEDERIYLVRNHELYSPRAAYTGTDFDAVWDSRAPGGCTVLVFDALKERWESARSGIAGTLFNCAGGPTPWGTWLTCEEMDDSKSSGGFRQHHGWVFEVQTDGASSRLPLTGLGRFQHEAAAVVNQPGDAQHGYVYMTEDNGSDPCGFYRFVPNVYGDLRAGGVLQMLKIKGVSKANMSRQTAKRWDVEWVKVPEPTKRGVFGRGRQKGGAIFTKLEGAWYGQTEHSVWFVSSYMGARGLGRIYRLDLAEQELHMVYESPSAGVLEFPDNLTVLSNGDALLCEDCSDNRRPRLHILKADGSAIFPICEYGRTGTEFTGATFHGKWLFVNSQSPGLSFAITGPWENGVL